MRNQQNSRIVPKSTSGSINDDGSRNIFSNPERHLAVDQSARASTAGSESPSPDVNPAAQIALEGRSEGGSAALDQSVGSLVSKEIKEDSQGSKGFKMAREKRQKEQKEQQQQQVQQKAQQPKPKQVAEAPPAVKKTLPATNTETKPNNDIQTTSKPSKQTAEPSKTTKSLTKKSNEPADRRTSKLAAVKSIKSHKSDAAPPQPKGRRYSMIGAMAGVRDVMKDVHESSKEKVKPSNT